ncbi:DNA primase [soil metagenome]
MIYPQYFIEDLKNRADLVRIIQPYAQDLKKKGANWMACCPFHQEKTPSFSVNPSKGFYKCFGCGKGGTAFNFLMEMEGLNFPEAIKRVAEISGVMLPEPIDDESYERTKKKREETKKIADQIIELNQIALEFWEAELQTKNAKAKAARKYLEQRGISEEIQKAFHIGFSPDKWDSLLNLLKEKGAAEKLIEQSGLVSVNEEKERVFDRFRGRIMFPVLDVNGKPVAFGARAMGDDQPKYLNSPETVAYIKGQHLYGLFQSKEEIRKKKFAILVEGYLDLIALYQFGITNVSASLGTAFTPEQSKLLSRFAKRVVINYDGDSAGIKAARKAAETLLSNDFTIKVFVIPNGKDPDDFIRENGAAKYDELRGKAQRYIQFFTDPRILGRNMGTASDRAKTAEEMLPFVRAIRSDTEQRECFDEIMQLCAIGDRDLQKRLWRTVHDKQRQQPGEIEKIVRRSVKSTLAERRLVAHLFGDPELRAVILPQIEISDYEALATGEIFAAFIALHDKQMEITKESVLEQIDDNEEFLVLIDELLTTADLREKDEPLDTILQKAEDDVIALRRMAIDRRTEEISRESSLAEAAGDMELLTKLTFERLELQKSHVQLRRGMHNM